ncbi:hypothetical protein TARUN_4442 [Trichoderma arundinaceum]|uniref:Uncharacterized protein n=1 Tax=Trichoderma arundinaceum TaxID=490622 RepID=A0A395NP72_TRIAR|nr:hypothetical protein TARUN_4442 [Trichoderma arundinaceum]
MASSVRNFEYDAVYPPQRSHRDQMRAGCASSCSSDEYSEDEDDDEEAEAYWSDCSACWARRNALRRGRASWRAGDGASGERGPNVYANVRRAAEGRDHRHSNRNESCPRGQQNSNYPLRNNTTASYNAAETPAYRGLADRIVLGTRQFYQGEDSLRHLTSWVRVLEDMQRRRYAAAGRETNNTAAPVAAAAPAATAVRTGQSSSSATVLGRASDASSRGAAAGEDGRMRQTQTYPRGGGRDYLMSGGRSISTNRRRRLR